MATAPPAPFDPWLNRVLGGRYCLVAVIGRGGMGVVYRAWDRIENRYAVVKMPRGELLSQGQFRERFAREMEVVRRLWHAAIVPVVDIGEEPLEGTVSGFGMPYAVMPYLAGGSLSRRQRKRDETTVPDPAESLWLWLPQIAEALDYVHSEGLVHRDVKPDNILFDGLGDPHLGDFGIAKVVLQADAETRGLTRTGMSIGTPEYMAPELVADATPDGRADQYALAVTVFEMLAGRKPFVANTPAAVLIQQATVPAPRLGSICRGLPPSLVDAVDRALAKKPESRFSSCGGFVHTLLTEVVKPGEAQKLRLMCPDCGELLKVKPSWAGQRGKCPRCTKQLVVSTDLRSLWLESDRSQATTAEPAKQRRTFSDAFGWLNRQGVAIGLVMGLVALIPWLLIASGFMSRHDADGLIKAEQAALQQLAVASAGEAAAVRSLEQAQEEVRRLREQLEQSAVDMAEQIESSRSREAELQQALTAQQELAESQLAMLEKVNDKATESKPTEPSDLPVAPLKTLTNSIGITLKLIPAGTFTMGQAGMGESEPPHEVTLTKPFYIGVCEVTNQQWKEVMRSVQGKPLDGNLPVANVSWDDANDFCRRLSVLPNEKHAGRLYRLPTEAEWEYACRAGSTTRYCFGDDESTLGDYAWFGGNSDGQTHAVGTKKPNVWGLYDMHGNVEEWCSDWYGYYGGRQVADPPGPSRATIGGLGYVELFPSRIFRGGSWRLPPYGTASRNGRSPSKSYPWIGFRLAMSLHGDEGTAALATEASLPPATIQMPPPTPPLTAAPFDAAQARKHQVAWAKQLLIDVEITNSIGQTFVLIPPGRLRMDKNEKPTEVTLDKPFLLGQTEVTQGQWKAVMGDMPSRPPREGDRFPVVSVSSEEAEAFCRALSALPIEQAAGRSYRLPTMIESEYASRAGTITTYCFGNNVAVLAEYAWYKNRDSSVGGFGPALVGLKRPNAWGLYDMHGNVWEWVYSSGLEDLMEPAVLIGGQEAANEKGPLRTIGFGGSWFDSARRCGSDSFGALPGRGTSVGFRLALIPSEADRMEEGK